MKLKEFFYYLGLKPSVKEYTFDLDHFQLSRDGLVELARWRHPKEQRKEISQASVDAIRSFLKKGSVAIDIGAHTGDTAVPIALAAGPSGAVFALEPNPYVFKVLLANAALNKKKTNIYPLMFAATPEDGEFEFEYSDPGFCNGGFHDGVDAATHSHFFKLRVVGRDLVAYLEREYPELLSKVDYIKVDTEGFDRSVVNSLRELLVRNTPYLKSEIYRHMPQEQREGYYRDLRDLGYRVHRFNDDEDYLGEELSGADLMKWEHFDVFAVHESKCDR